MNYLLSYLQANYISEIQCVFFIGVEIKLKNKVIIYDLY